MNPNKKRSAVIGLACGLVLTLTIALSSVLFFNSNKLDANIVLLSQIGSVSPALTPWDFETVYTSSTSAEISVIEKITSNIFLAGTNSGGDILRSTNAGDSWTVAHTTGEDAVLSISRVTDLIAIAGSYPDGKIFRTDDAGVTWDEVYDSASETSIQSISRITDSICVAGTYPGGEFLRSTDAGVNWTVAVDSAESGVKSISRISDLIAVAGTTNYSTNGKIYRTTDAGANWASVHDATSEDSITSIVAVTSLIAIAGSYPDGKIFRTDDAGANWTETYDSATENNIMTLVRMSDSLVYAGTADTGYLLKTENAGVNWEKVYETSVDARIHTLENIDDIDILVGTAGSSYGKILKGTPPVVENEEEYTGYNIFISSSASPGGDGTIETPYDEFFDINWTAGGTHSIQDWVAAGDEDIHINLKRGDTFRDMLQTELSGTATHNITIQAYGPGNIPPKINLMDVVGTGQPYGWILDPDATKLFTTYNIYRLDSPAGYTGQYISSSVADGSEKQKTQFFTSPISSSWSDFKDGYVFLYGGNTYYRRSDLTLSQMNDELFQAGARQMGVSGGLSSRLDNYWVVDGIDFVGHYSIHTSYIPSGSGSDKFDAGGIIAKGQYWTIRNCNFRQLGGCGTSTKGGSTIHSWVLEDNFFTDCWQGSNFFRYLSGSVHNGAGNHIVSRCSYYNTGTLEEDPGDKCAIQFLGNNSNIVQDCYIENVGWSSPRGGPGIILDTSEGNIIRRNYFKNMAGGCIGGGGASQRLDTEIYNNIFDGWGIQSVPYESPTMNCAVTLGGGAKNSEGVTNAVNLYGDMHVYNNIFVHGEASNPDPNYEYRAAIFVDGYDFTGIFIKNNIFAYNTTDCEYLLRYRPNYPSTNDGVNFQIKNNLFFDDVSRDIISHHDGTFFGADGLSGTTTFNGYKPGITDNIFGVDPLLNKGASDFLTWTINTPNSVKTGGENLNDSHYGTAWNNNVVWDPFPSRTFNYIFRGTTYSRGAYDE